MSKVVIRTDTVDGFFARAKDAARRADPAQTFDGKVTLSFEDPQRMFTVLSEARRRLMSEVMREPQTIKELTSRGMYDGRHQASAVIERFMYEPAPIFEPVYSL